ncbi:MAG: SlyX protein [Proteobacteria bacterium]|nr:MAG: SlyX protein [Pseudomonadota bacterium]PIE39880.1 MAG: SlyX protein [Gammaproteobacteria bacterium]
MHSELEVRLEELETRSAFQEDILESLNKVIADQQKEIDQLWHASQILKDQIRKLEYDSGEKGDGDAPPPHY